MNQNKAQKKTGSAGLYLFPSKKHHRKIVYILFLFPLLFTFGVTVIIPLVLGIGYSFTDWNGIRFTQFVGFANYAAMFRNPAFIYSVLITVAFVIANIVLVNVIAFLLALLGTSGIKGVGFFRATYFLPNLIGGIVLGYIWQFIFNNVIIGLTGGISLLARSRTAMAAIVAVYIWQYAGYIMPLPVAVQAFVGSYVKQWDLILTAALLAIIPMVVFFAAAQKWIMSGMVEGAVKG